MNKKELVKEKIGSFYSGLPDEQYRVRYRDACTRAHRNPSGKGKADWINRMAVTKK